MDEVQLFLRLHQLFGLQKEDMLLFFQPAFFLQLPLLGLRHLADEDIAHGLVGHRVPEKIELRPVPLVAGGLVGHHPILRHGGLALGQHQGEQGRAVHAAPVCLPVPGVDGGGDIVMDEDTVGRQILAQLLRHVLQHVLVDLGAPEQAEAVGLQADLQARDGALGHAVQELRRVLPAVAFLHFVGHVPDGADGGGLLVVEQGLHAQLDPGLLLVHGLELDLSVLAQGGLLQGRLERGLPLGGAV